MVKFLFLVDKLLQAQGRDMAYSPPLHHSSEKLSYLRWGNTKKEVFPGSVSVDATCLPILSPFG